MMHWRSVPVGMADSALSLNQTTLDGSLVPAPPQFSKSGLMDYIVELVVSEDDVGQIMCLMTHH